MPKFFNYQLAPDEAQMLVDLREIPAELLLEHAARYRQFTKGEVTACARFIGEMHEYVRLQRAETTKLTTNVHPIKPE